MIIGQELRQEGNTIILTNHINDGALRRQCHGEKRDGGKGFTPDRTMRKIGSITPSLMRADPLLREGFRAEMAGDDEWADRCYRLFFRLNPQYRCSEGGI